MIWNTLADENQLNQLLSESGQKLAIFKHSTRCSTSAMVKSRIERSWKFSEDFPIYLLDLISNRSVSNAIESRLNVRHESPQLIIVQDGEVLYHESHISISTTEAQSAE